MKHDVSDLERLKLVLGNLPDKPLIQILRFIRGKGRNEWPVEAMRDSFIVSFIFDYASIASLLRGFDSKQPVMGALRFPAASVFRADERKR